MQTVLQSGYSSLDGTDIWVRDLAYDTAADDDVLMAWDNVYAYENGGPEAGVFKKSAFTQIQRDPTIAQQIPDEFNTEVENDERPALVDNTPSNDNDSVTLKPGSFIEFIVKGRVDYFNDDIMGIEVVFDVDNYDYTTEIEIPTDYPYKVVTAPVVHPPVGTLVSLHTSNINTEPYGPGEYILASDNYYYGINYNTGGKKIHKDNPDIKKITILITK